MERAAFELTRRLLDRGFPVTVVARVCDVPPHPGLRWLRIPGPARPASVATAWFFLIGSLVLRRAGAGMRVTVGPVVLNRVDVITVHFCQRGFSRRPSSYRRSRDSYPYRLNAFVAAALRLLWEWWCFRPGRVRKLVPVSSGVARELRTHFPELADDIETIPNGVDVELFRPNLEDRRRIRTGLHLDRDAKLAVFIGNEWKRKGLRFAIEAVGAAPQWHLMVVGGGDTGAYRRLAKQCEADGRVHFIGLVEEPAPYFAAADAFVFPTMYEAFSLATLEAAASGLPLLVTRVSGAEDLVQHGENGWFIERDPATIVPPLRALAEQPDLKDRVGAAARAAVLPFSWERVTDEYERLLGGLATPSAAQA
jgi:UDP-glucose:(heptosyl)LPS alpha-1,3-glucosyltransferase